MRRRSRTHDVDEHPPNAEVRPRPRQLLRGQRAMRTHDGHQLARAIFQDLVEIGPALRLSAFDVHLDEFMSDEVVDERKDLGGC